jgi:hypothetical protein
MELLISNGLNVIEAEGPFNLELVIAGDAAQEKIDAELQAKGRWGTILIFRKSALASFEAVAQIEEILKRRKARGIVPVAVAIVVGSEVEGGALMSPYYLKAYTNAGIAAQLFETREMAEPWLLKMISSD